jgi:hypothetical protein
MKKTFPLHAPGKADARVLDAIKHEVRKYVRRELKKPLPEDAARWTFACRVGPDQATSQPSQLKDVAPAIDAIANTGVDSVYVEILAVPENAREE